MGKIGRTGRFSALVNLNGRPTVAPRTTPNFATELKYNKVTEKWETAKTTTLVVNVPASKTPTMEQVGASPLRYTFPMGITGVNHTAPVVEYAPIERPKLLPITDVAAGALHKVDFQFMIVVPQDSISRPIEDQIALLSDFSSSDNPVKFYDAHDSLISSFWLIEQFTYEITRTNTNLKATQANASMSLIEAVIPSGQRFLKLPKFAYGKTTGTIGSSTGNQEDEGDGLPISIREAILNNMLAPAGAEFLKQNEKALSDAFAKRTGNVAVDKIDDLINSNANISSTARFGSVYNALLQIFAVKNK